MYLVWGSRCELIHRGDAAQGRATNCNIPIRFQEQTPSLCIGGEVSESAAGLLACSSSQSFSWLHNDNTMLSISRCSCNLGSRRIGLVLAMHRDFSQAETREVMKHEPFISEVKHSMVFFRVGLTLNLEETRTAEARHGYCVLAQSTR